MSELPPGLFKLDIQKRIGSEYWTNRYILAGSGLAALRPAADAIVAAERAIHYNPVVFVSYRISDTDPNTDAYISGLLGGTGALSSAEVNLMPLFAVVRVDFETGTGRPSRKFLRGCLAELDSMFHTIDSARVLHIFQNYATPLVNQEAFVDVDGGPIVAAVVSSQVGMRQLRRGSKRRTQPVIPTG